MPLECGQSFGDLRPEYLIKPVFAVVDDHVVSDRSAVVLQAKMHSRIGERHSVYRVADMAELGGRRLEKFSARRRVVKNLFDLDGRARRSRRREYTFFSAALDPNSMGGRRLRRPRGNFQR